MRRSVYFILVSMLVLSLSVAEVYAGDIEFDEEKYGDNFDSYFISVFQNLLLDGGVITDFSPQNDIMLGINQGMALVTLMRLYDIYQNEFFIDQAIQISDFLATYLIDLRQNLVSSFYDNVNEFTSNYRNFADNLLITWGLDLLITAMNENGNYSALDIHYQNLRRDLINKDLNSFILADRIIGSYRVDKFEAPQSFIAYDNLLAAFIISQSDYFSGIQPITKKIYDYVKTNLTSTKGGVYSLYNSGFHDDLVTLRNTALYVNLALDLYETTDDESYLAEAIQSMTYIQENFVDVSKTGGYVEALIDDKPIQQSKSLFSHAIMLLTQIKMVNLEIDDTRLNMLSTARTIFEHFRIKSSRGAAFYSSITRNGDSASSQISVYDNLVMLYAISQLPIIGKVLYRQDIEFSDMAVLNVSLNIPDGVESTIDVLFDNKKVKTEIIKGAGDIDWYQMEITPPRPSSEVKAVDLKIVVTTENLTTDSVHTWFNVHKDTGITLSSEVITLFSVMLIVVFVFFLKSIGTQYIPKQ